VFRFHDLLLSLAVVASSHFGADFPDGLEGKCIRVFRGLAFMLKTKHVFYEGVCPLYDAWLVHDELLSDW
jgi:hypothetical protein